LNGVAPNAAPPTGRRLDGGWSLTGVTTVIFGTGGARDTLFLRVDFLAENRDPFVAQDIPPCRNDLFGLVTLFE
jgi:hypothetical protein